MKFNIFRYLIIIYFLTITSVVAKEECSPEFEITKPSSIVQSINAGNNEK